jgi:hypothetical protein
MAGTILRAGDRVHRRKDRTQPVAVTALWSPSSTPSPIPRYRCTHKSDGWHAMGPNGIELGVYARLNTLGGAKQACIMHNRKQGRR